MKIKYLNNYTGLLFVLLMINLQVVSAKKTNKSSTGSGFATVGLGNNCDYNTENSSIQDAIDHHNAEIRITGSGMYTGSLLINDQSVTLKGGYADCASAENGIVDNSRPTLNGLSLATVISIIGNSQTNEVILENLIIIGGNATGLSSAGGIFVFQADLDLHIENVLITNNFGIIGGGMAIINGQVNATIKGTVITQNTASEGGGLACAGENVSVIIDDGDYSNSNISLNLAFEGDGGGLLLVSKCEVTTYSGFLPNTPKTKGVLYNTAADNGGGVAVKGESVFNAKGYKYCNNSTCYGNNTAPVSVYGNIAEYDDENFIGSGGGIYVGPDSIAQIENTVISNNQATYGGGLAAFQATTVTVNSKDGECWNPGRCSQIINNDTLNGHDPLDGGGGGGVFVSQSDINISTTHIMGNQSDTGTALYMLSSNAILEGNMIVQNRDNGPNAQNYQTIRLSGGTMEMRYSTVADNDPSSAVFYLRSGALLKLDSNIIHESNGVDIIGLESGSVMAECVMAHEISTLPSETTVILDDPEFVDRLNGDFHLNAAISPAVDFCFANVVSKFNDIDNQARGWDDPNVNNGSGKTYDLGADEAYGNDIIFKNSFED